MLPVSPEKEFPEKGKPDPKINQISIEQVPEEIRDFYLSLIRKL